MPDRRAELAALTAAVIDELAEANRAREAALPRCRATIRSSGSAIRSVHRLEPARAVALADEAEVSLREAQDALAGFPDVAAAGFLHDAEKEYVEARVTIALVGGAPLPGPADLRVHRTSWMKGLAEAASEMRRHLLDRLRDGDVARAEDLLGVMDDVYDVLVTVDFPDALTGGLRRTVDQLRGVVERSRGDVTTTVLQTRLQRTLEAGDTGR